MAGGGTCAFCGATASIAWTDVLDEKWSRRFGGAPVVALDHGWYTTVHGERRDADHLDPAKYFGPHVRAACDFCAHGWVEDVRWRAEPTLLALAQGSSTDVSPYESAALLRWAQLTAMLAEQIDGMPQAASAAQRDAIRRAGAPAPRIDCWFFALRQRLPARVHLSQVAVTGEPSALVQIVSVDLAHLSLLVVLPSSEAARELVDGSGVAAALGAPGAVHPLDVKRARHPHHTAVQLLCAASGAC